MLVASGTRSTFSAIVGKAFSSNEQSSSTAAAELAILDRCGMETRITVIRLPAILGRDLRSDVQLTDPWVSRLHCVLSEIEGTVVVRDLGSKHGVFVNGYRVNDSHVLPGDRLTLGQTRVTVQYNRTEQRSRKSLACEVLNTDSLPPQQEHLAMADTADHL